MQQLLRAAADRTEGDRTAILVELRRWSGAGWLDCRRALELSGYNIDEAHERLRVTRAADETASICPGCGRRDQDKSTPKCYLC